MILPIYDIRRKKLVYDPKTKKSLYVAYGDPVKQYHSLDMLLEQLAKLKKEGFVFRGLKNSTYDLKPSVFREDKLKAMEEKFENVAPTHKEWGSGEKCKKIIKDSGAQSFLDEQNKKKLIYLTLYTMQYNYSLHLYCEENIEKFDAFTKQSILKHSPEYWTSENTFVTLLGQALWDIDGRCSLDGKEIYKRSTISEQIAVYDESLPQHYGVSTASLDWSYNQYIALYFCSEGDDTNKSPHISICAYKEISIIKNPLEIKAGNPGCHNDRIEKQEGCFICFKTPCGSYFRTQEWPSIEQYAHYAKNTFEVIKFDIPRIYEQEMQYIADCNNINKETLGL